MKLKKGDQVLIISGKDKGRKGKIIDVFSKENRVSIEGINLKKKHVKPKKQGEKGQIVQLPGAMDSSNLKIVCPKCGKASRIGYKLEGLPAGGHGKNKFRICKKCKQEI